MTISFDEQGNTKWNFYRKTYKKSRWRKTAFRLYKRVLAHGYRSGLIIVT